MGRTTNHNQPWALVRRGGDTLGKRPNTRMAYLVDTVVGPDGKAVALRGYVMNNDMTNWTKNKVRIEWADVVKQWRHQPTAAEVRRIKSKMRAVTAESERRGWSGKAGSGTTYYHTQAA
jgi:hypothetical protein